MERGAVMVTELVKRAKKGDKDALVQLIMAQKHDYYRLAYVYMKNKEDALDIMEDMIVRLFENISSLKKEEGFYSWSKTILVNLCKTSLKKSKRVIAMESIEAVQEEYVQEENDERLQLEAGLSRLDIKYQEIIKLRYFMDMDYQSIADMLKLPLGTVKSRLFSAIRLLKEYLGGEDHEEA